MNEVLKRLYLAKERQIKTGFAERHPDLHENLICKIEHIENGGEYTFTDVTAKLLAQVGGYIPVIHLKSNIDSIMRGTTDIPYDKRKSKIEKLEKAIVKKEKGIQKTRGQFR